LNGWIKVHREIVNHWVWKDKPFTRGQAWLDLLMMANHTTGTDYRNGHIITVERGQRITSILKLSDRWGWSRKKVSGFLNRLEADGMLEQKRTTQDTTLTIVNYGLYQSGEQRKEQQKNSAGTTKEQRRNTNKKEKNIKNKNICSPEPDERESDFEKIYAIYPKKRGRTKAFDNYCIWLKGKTINGKRRKLTNRKMYIAVRNYVKQEERAGTELQFYKNFDTLMGKQLLDYVEEEQYE